ncbi:hypothetical protein GSI_05275 [Ganoderma sinense ZZ0214-1]|uniref:Uncharacterized protein n=1 Tax=Ganoderma sinense ZZ0214-1 TaxID=1077348 RepID=A0A2G8SFN1_9APHY|nr:hypothetical protein GSI_05275 [Ganoderma sinense ZZ0214-1]
MRLLDTRTIRFVYISDPNSVTYAILSHTWDLLGEQSLQELAEIQRTHPGESVPSSPALSPKIRDFCAFARNAGYDYCWIDSCCIDKTSSSELTESINSMYAWYCIADVCYTYLADVSSSADKWEEEFRASRWHRRGWTLQELIAPKKLVFLSCDWLVLGSKAALAPLVEDVTGISISVLMFQEPLSAVPVARRMSWAASRETTRAEDRAYSLFGIFDVQLPTIYGEGGERAFVRLQEEILRHIQDQSIFAWGLRPPPSSDTLRILPRFMGGKFSVTKRHALLASSPSDFQAPCTLELIHPAEFNAMLRLIPNILVSLDCSAYGIHSILTHPPVYPVRTSAQTHGPTHIAILACKDPARGFVVLLLRRTSTISPDEFSIGASMVPGLASLESAEDLLEPEVVHATYITPEQVAALRSDVVLLDLQPQWMYTCILLVMAVPAIVLAIYGSGRTVALYAGPIMAAVMTIAAVGLVSGIYLLLGGYDPIASCDENQTESVAFFLFRQVPAASSLACGIAFLGCKMAGFIIQGPDASLWILLLLIPYTFAASILLFNSSVRVRFSPILLNGHDSSRAMGLRLL